MRDRKLANVLKCLLLGVGCVGGALAQSRAPAKPAADICPYSAAEIEKALGLKYRWVSPAERTDEGVRHTVCRGIGEGHSGYLFIKQAFHDPVSKKLAVRLDAQLRSMRPKAEAVPGDPDRAQWTIEGTTHWLGYVRGPVITTLTLTALPREIVGSLRERMLKLIRVSS